MATFPLTRRSFVRLGGLAAAGGLIASSRMFSKPVNSAGPREFDVRKFGAVGDGTTLDSAAIQKAIDTAASAGGAARVLVPGGHKFLVGTLELRSNLDFHLADDAELIVSTDPAHYRDRAILIASGAEGLKISGTGNINGRAREFMTEYEAASEWWRPKEFRPRIFALAGCRHLEVRDLSFSEAPSWGLHLLGCEQVLVDGLRIRNFLDVPNCDGIDPDHCRDVEIKNCQIVCGDDAIVIKTTRQGSRYGASARIRVSDCVIETQDSGVKIGTETTQDISAIRFERCKIRSSARGLTIQLRDEGNVSDISFSDIEFTARFHSDPWWGRGEALSFTALPRAPGTKVGQLSDVRVRRVTGRAENSARVEGTADNPVTDVTFEDVSLTLDRWTKYRGRVYDNRPTSAVADLPSHDTPAFNFRHAKNISLKSCRVSWGKNPPDYFTHAVEAEETNNVVLENFVGKSAHPDRLPAIKLPPTANATGQSG